MYSHTYGIYKNTVPKLYIYVYMCPLELSCDLKICTKNMLGNVYKVSKQIQGKAGAQILGLLSPDLLLFSSVSAFVLDVVSVGRKDGMCVRHIMEV